MYKTSEIKNNTGIGKRDKRMSNQIPVFEIIAFMLGIYSLGEGDSNPENTDLLPLSSI